MSSTRLQRYALIAVPRSAATTSIVVQTIQLLIEAMYQSPTKIGKANE